MDQTLLWWVIPILVALEAGGVAYWRRDQYPRFLFNAWAPTLYGGAVCGDLLLAALLTLALGEPGRDAVTQRAAMLSWALAAGLLTVALALLTLFFRWIAHTDITDGSD